MHRAIFFRGNKTRANMANKQACNQRLISEYKNVTMHYIQIKLSNTMYQKNFTIFKF